MDDRLDIRQRRAIATSHSYPDSDSNSTDIISSHSSPTSCSPFPTLASRWRARRMNAQLPLCLGMRLIEVVLMAFAMFLLPTMIQYFVRCVDELHGVVGRRARSPFASISGSKVLVGAMVFVVWHVIVVQLGYVAFVGNDERGEKRGEDVAKIDAGIQRGSGRTPWSRILGRVLLPSYLALALLFFFYQLTSRLLWPTFAASNADGHLDATTPHSRR